MDSLKKLLTDLASWHWWFTVVFVGLAINLASAYLKPTVDELLGNLSARRRAKNESAERELHRQAETLVGSPTLLVLEGLAELRNLLLSSLLLLAGFAMAGAGIAAMKMTSEKSVTLLAAVVILFLVGIASHVLFFAMFNRATERMEVISLATRMLITAKDG